MTPLTARFPLDRPEDDDIRHPAESPRTCGGAPILDLALCLILAVTVIGLFLLAL